MRCPLRFTANLSSRGSGVVVLSAVGASGRLRAVTLCFTARLLAPLVGGALLRSVLQQISHLEGPAVALSGALLRFVSQHIFHLEAPLASGRRLLRCVFHI